MRNNAQVKFVRFADLRWSDINCDLHIHTDRTDGVADIASIMACAVEQKLAKLAFTEHVRHETPWFSEFVSEVRTVQQRFKQLEVLVGCETKAVDAEGTLDVTEEILAACDIVLGSVHRFPDGHGGYYNFAALSPEQLAHLEFDLAMGLLRFAPIDVLAHPGGMYARRHGDFPPHLMRELLEESLKRSIAVEISSSYVRDFSAFLELCTEINPYVSIGSDVHVLEHLGYCRDRLQAWGIKAC